MTIWTKYNIDRTKEANGVWYELKDSPNADGSIPRFLIARMGGGNKRFLEAYEELWAPYRQLQQENKVPEDVKMEVSAKVFAKACLKTWDHVPTADESGWLDATEDNAISLLISLPELFEELQQVAMARERYLKTQEAIAAKN